MAVRALHTTQLGLRQFTVFTGAGVGATYTILQDAGPELLALADEYPKLFSRALRHLANRVREEIGRAIRRGHPPGAGPWQPRSLVHQYRRLDWSSQRRYGRLKLRQTSGYRRYVGARAGQGAYNPLRGAGERKSLRHYSRGGRLYDQEQPIPDAFSRWIRAGGKDNLRSPGPMTGFLEKSIRYKQISANRVDVGAVSPSAAYYLEKVQRGQRTVITPLMRVKFWAAGVPLANSKKVLEQEPRPLISGVYDYMRPYFEPILLDRIQSYLAGRKGETASVLNIPGLWNYGS